MKTKHRKGTVPRPCPQAGEVVPYLQGALCGGDRDRFEAHLSACAACRSAAAGLRPIVQRLQALPPAPARDLTARIMTQIPQEEWSRSKTGLDRGYLRSRVLRLAAGVAIAVGLGTVALFRMNKPPEVATLALQSEGATREAVRSGRVWLGSAQEPDGHWDPVKWGAPGQYAVGITALAVLACSADGGQTSAEPIRHGLEYLMSRQDASGRIGPDFTGSPYNHSLATLALLRAGEAGGRTAAWTNGCRRAIEVICASQTPAGGWGYAYGTGGQVNTSVTVWQLQALLAARARGFEGLDGAIAKGVGWLVNTVNGEGLMGYVRSDDFPYGYETMTAAGLLCLLKTPLPVRQEQTIKRMLGAVLKSGDKGSEIRDYCRSYFFARALDLVSTKESKLAASNVRDKLVALQNTAGGQAGSWSPDDRWSAAGGRVYATAISVLALNNVL